MNITEAKKDDTLEISVEGNVDTNTAPRLQETLLQAFQKSSKVVLDLDKCPYMSSAGLRALLIAQKTAMSKGGALTICNVKEAVMSVFKMTKFDAVLNIV